MEGEKIWETAEKHGAKRVLHMKEDQDKRGEEEKVKGIVIIGQQQQSAECTLLLLLFKIKQSSMLARKFVRKLKFEAEIGKYKRAKQVVKKLKFKAEMGKDKRIKVVVKKHGAKRGEEK